MLLLLCLAVAVLFARRRLGITEPSECLALGLALAQLGLLLLSNGVLRGPGWSWWLPVLGGACLGIGLWVAYRPVAPVAPRGRCSAAMLGLALISLVVAWLLQSLQVDDDYWIHTPIQGMLLRGDFPPHNLFYPGLELKGHYGRDLLIVVWARLTGWSPFTSQIVMSTLLQPVQLLLIYWAVWRQPGGQRSAFWATLFVAVGVQSCGRCGLLVLVQNNNPVCHTWFALVLYLLSLTWAQRRLRWALLLGLALGSMAIVYETHFGLSCLASLVAFGFTLAYVPARREWVRLGLVAALSALLLACTQGGPLTDLAARALGVRAPQAGASIGLNSQRQHVTLHFPKQRLFQLRCRATPNRWVEKVSDGAWLYRFDQLTDPNQGYAPFWDPAILGLHSCALYLSPLLGVWAFKRRQWLVLWLVAFGFFAFLTPAVVDFGPVFESEYLRWEFAAGLAFAGALGIAIGPYLEFPMRRPGVGCFLALLFLVYCTSDLRSNLWQTHVDWLEARRHGRPTWYWGARDWVTRHSELDFSQADWQAARWLRDHSNPTDTVLVDPVPRPHQVAYESTLVGLTGLKASRRVPLDTDVVGLVPSRQRADVSCFLHSGDPGYLDLFPAQWVLRRSPRPLPVHPEVEGTLLGQRWLGRIRHRYPDWPRQLAAPLQLEVKVSGLPALCDEGKVYPLVAHASRPPGSGRLILGVRALGESRSDPEDWVPYPLEREGKPLEREGKRLWMAPYRAGEYNLAPFWWDEAGVHPLPLAGRFTVDTTRRLIQARLESVTLQPNGLGDGWGEATVRFRAPILWSDDYVGGAAFTSSRDTGDPAGQQGVKNPPLDQPQNLDLQRISEDLWQFRCRTLLPPGPDRLRLDVFLSPFHGTTLRLAGPQLEVTPEFYTRR